MRAKQDHSGGPVSVVLVPMLPSEAPVEAMNVKLLQWEPVQSMSGNSCPTQKVHVRPTTRFVPLPPSEHFLESGAIERLPGRKLVGFTSLFVPSTLHIHEAT